MKKTLFFIASTLLLGIFNGNAQATTASATNTVTASAYLGSGASSNFDVLFKRQAVAAGLIATNKTSFGLNSSAMPESVSIGVNSGQFSSGSGFNTYIGQDAGKGQSASILNSGIHNTFIGNNSGASNTTGSSNFFGGSYSGFGHTSGNGNTFLGNSAGQYNLTGSSNTFVGDGAGGSNNGNLNTFIGSGAGYNNDAGSNNTFLGNSSGFDSTGSNNVFIGPNAGFGQSVSNKLIIDIEEASTGLIWGDFAADQLKFHAKVGIGGNSSTAFGNFPTTAGGVTVSSYNLFVKGGILTEEVRVSAVANWADYVFKKDYNLKSLAEVETFINENGHLPNVPSAAEVEKNGIEVGQMAKIQQEKIEELTLYIIKLNKKIEEQEKRLNELEKKNN